MTSPLTQPPRADRSRRVAGWLLPAALLAFAPKCLLCVAAYAGLGTALGLGAPELCGASAAAEFSWSTALAVAGIALATAGIFARLMHRRAVSMSRR